MKTPNRYIPVLLALFALSTLNAQLSTASAQGTAFTYQGRLNDGSGPASGAYNLKFTLFNTNTTGVAIAGPVTDSAVSVTNGLFTVLIDFGPGVFIGATNWLEIGVETNGGSLFTTLTPRQQLTPVPYAIFAEGASNVLGVVPDGGLGGSYGNAVTLNNAANSFNGSYTGNGGGLTNVNAATLGGLASSNFWQTGGNNVASGQFLGSTNNQPVEVRVNNMRALRLELNADTPNVIGGASNNVVGPGVQGATIAGGGSVAFYGGPYPNRVDDFHATIGGGLGNWIQANAYESTIAGGNQNQIQNGAYRGFIGGGIQNLIGTNASSAVIGGGSGNQIFDSTPWGIIVGGEGNVIQSAADHAVIGGGYHNTIVGSLDASTICFIGGGGNNVIQTNNSYATVVGGSWNLIQSNASYTFIGGGISNAIQDGASVATIAGGNQNQIQTGAFNSAIGGGVLNRIGTDAFAATLGGGNQNQIQNGAYRSTIGGGSFNLIQTNAAYATIAGGRANLVQNNATESFIGGGDTNIIQTSSVTCFIGGGSNNVIRSGSYGSVIVGGWGNQASNNFSAVLGGAGNVARGAFSTAAGFSSLAAGNVSTALGSSAATGDYSVAMGGSSTASGMYSLAAGNQARAETDGSFVWADANSISFDPYVLPGPQGVANSFNVRATGGFYFVTAINGSGTITAGVQVPAGSGSWSSLSDRNAKTNFAAVNSRNVLEKLVQIPVESWNYKSQAPAIRHIGPMAQDFAAAFGMGEDDKHIATIDEEGVALAAIQGLNEKVEVRMQNAEVRSRRLEEKLEQKETEVTELKQQNESLGRRLAALEKIVLNQKSN